MAFQYRYPKSQHIAIAVEHCGKRIKIIYGFIFEGWYYKGQLILKCPIGVKSQKKIREIFSGFLP